VVVENFGPEALLEDDNFKVLVSPSTELEEFTRLIQAHAPGYTQRKRVLEAVKHLLAELEVIENKLIVAKAVGKSKGLEEKEQHRYHLYSVNDLKEKVQALNKSIEASMDAGTLTAEEQGPALEQLESRLEKAKADGKAKLQEKLERMIGVLSKADPVPVPVPEIKQIQEMQHKVDQVDQWSKQPKYSLTEEQREAVREKTTTEKALAKLEAANQMWFESEKEFRPRLKQALIALAAQQEEEARLEAIRLEEEKKLAAKRKEEQKWAEIQKKIDEKRELAKQAPAKPAPAPKKKEKKKVIRLDNNYLFGKDEENAEYDEGDDIASPDAADIDAEERRSEEAAASTTGEDGAAGGSHLEDKHESGAEQSSVPDAEEVSHTPPASPGLKSGSTSNAKNGDKPKETATPPKTKANVWAVSSSAPAVAEEPADDGEEQGVGSPDLGPSLAEAATSGKKKAATGGGSAPAPKKAGKKKFAKMSLDSLGFEYSDAGQPNSRPSAAGPQKSAWGAPPE